MERTLIILKPDALQRGLAGRILARFETKGLKIVGMKLTQISRNLAETHYEAHREKPFYAGLVRFMTSSPVAILALEGKGAIEVCRKMMGATFGSKAEPGTIRGELWDLELLQPHSRLRLTGSRVPRAVALLRGRGTPRVGSHRLALDLRHRGRALSGRGYRLRKPLYAGHRHRGIPRELRPQTGPSSSLSTGDSRS